MRTPALAAGGGGSRETAAPGCRRGDASRARRDDWVRRQGGRGSSRPDRPRYARWRSGHAPAMPTAPRRRSGRPGPMPGGWRAPQRHLTDRLAGQAAPAQCLGDPVRDQDLARVGTVDDAVDEVDVGAEVVNVAVDRLGAMDADAGSGARA